MNTVDRLRRVLGTPRLLVRGLNRMYYRRGGFRTENVDGVDIFSEDWDNLVVLDACRYDMFEQINRINGHLSAKTSKGSATAEWLRANFTDRDLSDTVYVTANPQLERHRSDWDLQLYETINVWLDEGWDEPTGTVLAEIMTEAAIDASDRFPNKRLVVHYMQPHYPFVRSDTTFDKEHLVNDGTSESSEENVWGQKFAGELSVTHEELWSMYVDNLKYVLDHVEDLIDALIGKSIITSDHGNYVGERASPIPIREREIVAESDEESADDIESKVMSERLRDLGYKT